MFKQGLIFTSGLGLCSYPGFSSHPLAMFSLTSCLNAQASVSSLVDRDNDSVLHGKMF